MKFIISDTSFKQMIDTALLKDHFFFEIFALEYTMIVKSKGAAQVFKYLFGGHTKD